MGLTEKEGAQPGLAVPLKHGPKNENASLVARRSTEQEDYTISYRNYPFKSWVCAKSTAESYTAVTEGTEKKRAWNCLKEELG
jgi:hypothetical protein